MKEARFIQIIDMQNILYALDEEGRVWRYGEEPSGQGPVWIPLSSKRYETPTQEPGPTVGFRSNRPIKG